MVCRISGVLDVVRVMWGVVELCWGWVFLVWVVFFFFSFFFFFNDTATTEIYTLSLHDALPI